MRGVHSSGTEGRGRVAHQCDVVAHLYAEPACRLDAAAGHQADGIDPVDAVLFELGVEVGIGEAALRTVLMNDYIATPASVMPQTILGVQRLGPTRIRVILRRLAPVVLAVVADDANPPESLFARREESVCVRLRRGVVLPRY
jgi:hypothetical protein